MIVGIQFGELNGTIEYNDSKAVVNIEGPVKNDIERYLHTSRKYWIPESQRIDDFRIDTAKPVDSLTYFELALCTLFDKLGVYVDWYFKRKK